MGTTPSEASEHHRDGRRAYGELAASLQVLGDKLEEVQTALSSGDRGRAQKAIDGAVAEIDAAHGFLAIARDEHRALGRSLKQVAA